MGDTGAKDVCGVDDVVLCRSRPGEQDGSRARGSRGLGKLREAEGLLNQLTKRSNHLGLYSEEIDPKTGEALGNFPQAYTHMGLITASVHLEEARRKSGLIRYAKAISNRISGR